jgi:hypothetical protein
VLVPSTPACSLRIGLLVAPVTIDAVKTRFMRLAEFDRKRIEEVFEEMREQTMSELTKMAIPEAAVTFERS